MKTNNVHQAVDLIKTQSTEDKWKIIGDLIDTINPKKIKNKNDNIYMSNFLISKAKLFRPEIGVKL
jgi:hypothetical protein